MTTPTIKITVHSINRNQSTAVISLVDAGVVYWNKNNIGVRLDFEAIDSDWFYKYIKLAVIRRRYLNLERNEEDLL